MTCFEKIMAILNLVAIVGIPILAVAMGQYLQGRAEKRKDKMQIFRTLMTSRIYGWTVDSVHALNLIDVRSSKQDGTAMYRPAHKTVSNNNAI